MCRLLSCVSTALLATSCFAFRPEDVSSADAEDVLPVQLMQMGLAVQQAKGGSDSSGAKQLSVSQQSSNATVATQSLLLTGMQAGNHSSKERITGMTPSNQTSLKERQKDWLTPSSNSTWQHCMKTGCSSNFTREHITWMLISTAFAIYGALSPRMTLFGAPARAARSPESGVAAASLAALGPAFTSDGLGLKGPALPELHEAIANGGVVAAVHARADSFPDSIALVAGRGGTSITYRELSVAIKFMADAFIGAGLKEGDVVAVFLPASPAFVKVLLGAMQVGIVWLPLDPETPAPRLETLFRVAGVRLSICLDSHATVKTLRSVEDGLENAFPHWVMDLMGDLSETSNTWKQLAPLRPGTPKCPQNTAALFFTSGSSGVPKGVAYGSHTVAHGSLSMKKLCRMNSSSVALLKTPTIWAVVEYELFPALFAGGRVVCDAACQKDMQRLADTIAAEEVTTLVTSGPVIKALIEGTWTDNTQLRDSAATCLKDIVNVGAAMPLDVCSMAADVLPVVAIHNMYGCTECACTQWTYRDNPATRVAEGGAPAGRPQPEVNICIMDDQMQPKPLGESGEVCIGSAFNSLGYLGDEALNRIKFVPDPTDSSVMFYKTGDLGALVPDIASPSEMVLQITGRKDRQFNIMGIRVAPEEVETVISQVPGVEQVAVVAGGDHIVAYFSPNKQVIESRDVSTDLVHDVKEACVRHLTEKQRPELVIQMEMLPKLQNGKINLRELTERAKEAAKESLTQAVDSLGLMKNVSKDRARELNMLASMRALAMMAVMLFHVFWSQYNVGMSANLILDSFEQASPGYSRWFLRGLMNMQLSMYSFSLMSGHTDRRAVEEGTPGQMRENLVVVLMYIGCGSKFFSACIQQTQFRLLGDTDVYIWDIIGTHSWYLMWWLECRIASTCVLMPLERLYRKTRFGNQLRFATFFLLLVYLWVTNMDAMKEHHTAGPLRDFYPFRIVRIYGGALASFLWITYVFSWFFSKPVAAFVWKRWPKRFGSALPCALVYISMTFIGWYDELKAPMWDWYGPFSGLEMVMSSILAGLIMLALYFVGDSPWLSRLGLIRCGSASMGTYIIHFFFLQGNQSTKWTNMYIGVGNHYLPPPNVIFESVRPYIGGIGQLLVLYLYCLAFGLTFGQGFQALFLKCFFAIELGVVRLANNLKNAIPWSPLVALRQTLTHSKADK